MLRDLLDVSSCSRKHLLVPWHVHMDRTEASFIADNEAPSFLPLSPLNLDQGADVCLIGHLIEFPSQFADSSLVRACTLPQFSPFSPSKAVQAALRLIPVFLTREIPIPLSLSLTCFRDEFQCSRFHRQPNVWHVQNSSSFCVCWLHLRLNLPISFCAIS